MDTSIQQKEHAIVSTPRLSMIKGIMFIILGLIWLNTYSLGTSSMYRDYGNKSSEHRLFILPMIITEHVRISQGIITLIIFSTLPLIFLIGCIPSYGSSGGLDLNALFKNPIVMIIVGGIVLYIAFKMSGSKHH